MNQNMKIKYITKEEYEKLLIKTADEPIESILGKVQYVIGRGGIAFIKFWCSYCGSRQTSSEPNKFNTGGYYCQECGELNTPKKYGMMVIFSSEKNIDQIVDMLKKGELEKIFKNRVGDTNV